MKLSISNLINFSINQGRLVRKTGSPPRLKPILLNLSSDQNVGLNLKPPLLKVVELAIFGIPFRNLFC